ncbi:hypothetical protein [Nonomuraea sp. NPDC049400]|uniref:hypothetical protein n=1 Tax=Nonomuraea sp. NPDC049400 TaxID=3364352 RepID=UPI0037AD9D9E
MRVRAGIVAAGIAALAAIGIAAPAQAAGWTYIGEYTSRSKCIDMGQSYQREGWDEYKCEKNATGWYYLWVR